MTTDELRAAAEMVVATGTHKDWFDTIDAGALAVARAWLAEHPADDGEVVTAEWLEAEGFVRPDALYTSRFRKVCGRVSLHLFPWVPGWAAEVRQNLHNDGASNIVSLPGVLATRGDVRRLLAALGVGGAA